MSVIIPLVIRVLALFGVRLSPFAGGAIVAGLVALALGGASFALYLKGYHAAEATCEAAALRSQIAALERDAAVARDALADARLRAAGIELQSNAEKAETQNYVEQLKARFASACAINDDDLRGMRINVAPGAAAGAAAGGRRADAPGRPAGRAKGR